MKRCKISPIKIYIFSNCMLFRLNSGNECCMVKRQLQIHYNCRMYLLYITLCIAAAVSGTLGSPSASQLLKYKEKHEGQCKIMTTSAGSPVEYNDASRSLNTNLIDNEFFMDFFTHMARERIPERVVHAKGAGAFGYFEVTHNISNTCNAKLFREIGKRTPVAVRFSPVVVERGGIDTSREPRGFAVKFYTEDGNFDLAGFSIPVFPIKDPILFPSFVHIRRNPTNNLHDANMFWDFVTLHPETLHAFMYIFGDGGIPNGYRHMPGFSIHTFQVVNDCGESYFVRFHLIPDAGIKFLYSEEALSLAGTDPDYATRDLYDAIGEGNYPSWKVSVQILSSEDVKNAKFDVFDVTKVLPLDDYPLHPVGNLVLDRNPNNFFAEIEQLGFTPGNLIPHILGAPDKLFESRRFAYRETLNYRLGGNFNKILVNCPMRNHPYTYNRDGEPPVNDNDGDAPNYYPNSFNGPKAYVDKNRGKLMKIHEDDADNFDQIKDLYVNGMSEDERCRAIANIVSSLKGAVEFLQERAVKLFTLIHPDLGKRVKQGLTMDVTETTEKMCCSCQD